MKLVVPYPRSIRARLTLWNVGVMALVLVLLGATIHYRARADLLASVDRELEAKSRRLVGIGARRGFPPAEERVARSPFVLLPSTPFRPRVLDPYGRSVSQYGNDRAWDAEAFTLSLQSRSYFSTVRVEGEPVRVYSRPVVLDGRVVKVVQFAYPLAETRRALAGLARTLLAFIPIGLLVAGVGGAWLTERALRPVRQITQTAERIGAQNLSGRLAVAGDDEFAQLGRTFNGMLGRLEAAFGRMEQTLEQQRRFTGDASHELRTPLTVIKANTSLALKGSRSEDAYKRSLQAIDRAADTMSELVQDLLLLARSDGGQLGRNVADLSLAEVLERAAEPVRTPENALVHVTLPDETLTVAGNTSELTRLFANLLQNAARHTPPEGEITIAARAEGNHVVVTVADTGAGIAPEHLPHLGERFYRVDASRTRTGGAMGGTGLGLAITKSIVQAHGGTLKIESVLGQGTTVTVTLPRATTVAEASVGATAGR